MSQETLVENEKEVKTPVMIGDGSFTTLVKHLNGEHPTFAYTILSTICRKDIQDKKTYTARHGGNKYTCYLAEDWVTYVLKKVIYNLFGNKQADANKFLDVIKETYAEAGDNEIKSEVMKSLRRDGFTNPSPNLVKVMISEYRKQQIGS